MNLMVVPGILVFATVLFTACSAVTVVLCCVGVFMCSKMIQLIEPCIDKQVGHA